MKILTCWKCKCQYGIPDELYVAAQAANRALTFYCPYGHGAAFPEGETDADKLRRERDRLKQQLAQKDDELIVAYRQAAAARGETTKLKKRVHNGVCPCCTRSFQNLKRHISTKHPDYLGAN